MTSQIVAMLAAAGLVTAGMASTAETRSASAIPVEILAQGAAASQGCAVNVQRTGAAGQFDVTRQTLRDGSCVCNVTTGEAASNGNAEPRVEAILRDRECAEAPVVADTAPAATGGGAMLGILLGVAGAGGLAAGLGGSSKG